MTSTFTDALVTTAVLTKQEAQRSSGLERQRLHALADTLLAEARSQGAKVRLLDPATFESY